MYEECAMNCEDKKKNYCEYSCDDRCDLAIINGFVIDEENMPVENARVKIYYCGEVVANCKTNECGYYQFRGKPGYYMVCAKKGCKSSKTKRVCARRGCKAALANLVLCDR